MSNVVRRAFRQWSYRAQADHAASVLRLFRLGLRFDCYVSPSAFVYYPQKIRLARGVQIHPQAMLNYRSNYSHYAVNIIIE